MSREQGSVRLKAEPTEAALLAEVDEQLRAALSIQPSPNFQSKVWARIEERWIGDRWRRWPWIAAAACALVMITAWSMVGRLEEATPAHFERTRIGRDARLAAIPPPLNAGPAFHRLVYKSASCRCRYPAIAAQVDAHDLLVQVRASEPEVIVPEQNVRALARLLALARNRTIDEEKLRPVDNPESAFLEPAPLVVPPIVVLELDSLTVTASANDGQRQ